MIGKAVTRSNKNVVQSAKLSLVLTKHSKLTPWKRVHEKLTVPQLVKKFPVF
jgi:hypothetical protein